MNVNVVRSYKPKLWSVKISQGVQSFTLDYHASKKDATWMAKMFRLALVNNVTAEIMRRSDALQRWTKQQQLR